MNQERKTKATILWFEEINKKDAKLVGGKNASLGEMYSELRPLGINIPNGFAICTNAYKVFLARGGLDKKIKEKLKNCNKDSVKDLQEAGKEIRQLILRQDLPKDAEQKIIQAYAKLGRKKSVAVRSSAAAEDLSDASFAGQQETYLNVIGQDELLEAIKKVYASLFTDRAISYRHHKGFAGFGAISIGVQEMVRSDLACSGVMFTIDPETGFKQVMFINAAYGLGETIAQGDVTPDEFIVFKPMLEASRLRPSTGSTGSSQAGSGLRRAEKGIIEREIGPKKHKLIYGKTGTKMVAVLKRDQKKLCLSDPEVIKLAAWGVQIEKHFKKPMDIEWAKDGKTGKLYIVQARPETVHTKNRNAYKEYTLAAQKIPIITGMGVGMKIVTGKVRLIANPKDMGSFIRGEILVTETTDPDWEPIIKIAGAVITDKGGRTSHASIVSREFGIPAVVGTALATKTLKTGQTVTVDCSSGDEGRVYEGIVQFTIEERTTGHMPTTKTKVMLNIGSPDEAFKNAYLPVRGVGLGRLEFIINSYIKIHPNALIDYPLTSLDSLRHGSGQAARDKSFKVNKQIDELTRGYKDKKQFYVDKLAEGIAKIAAAFWPHEVIIRFSDFKTNEYRQLIGGELYESQEQNPMLGWRGASRYYDERFKKAFGLECIAVKKVREEMGLSNVTPMVPFCRTPEEGRKVIGLMESFGLSRKTDQSLRVYVMCEIPSNVILADEFLDVFDGMSIGSNDLTQLCLGIDRDLSIGAAIGNENNAAVKYMVASVIKKCQERKKYVGICGQAPSDYPEFARFLVKQGIESMSLNPDAVVQTIREIKKAEDGMVRK